MMDKQGGQTWCGSLCGHNGQITSAHPLISVKAFYKFKSNKNNVDDRICYFGSLVNSAE